MNNLMRITLIFDDDTSVFMSGDRNRIAQLIKAGCQRKWNSLSLGSVYTSPAINKRKENHVHTINQITDS